MHYNRRDVVTAGVALGAASVLGMGVGSWVWRGKDAAPGRMVVVMLRGAIDGLSVVAPYTDAHYASVRPTIALPPPGHPGGLLPLIGPFGLHPSLAPLLPLWNAHQLAFVQASGAQNSSRSHFDAQEFMEVGYGGAKDGWMNRLIGVLPTPIGPTTAISLGQTRPQILYGAAPSTAFPLGSGAEHRMAVDRPDMAKAFSSLYSGRGVLDLTFQAGKIGRSELMEDLVPAKESAEMHAADHGAPPPGSFPAITAKLADIIVRDPRVRLAFADLGGWDTHVGQGRADGALGRRLQPLAQGLALMAQRLGSEWSQTTVVVMSEFGRTVHENGDGGTDHGHGNVMWVLGGRVRGGQVYGDWPGLDPSALYQGRDLEVTTDFRAVLAQVLGQHMRLKDTELAHIFPERATAPGWLSRLYA